MNKLFLLTLCVLAVVMVFSLACKKEVAPTEKEETKPGELELQAEIDKIEASSTLVEDPKEPNRFAPDKLNDGLASTCWAEGAKGWGQGEWVKFTFNVPVDIYTVEIINGFAVDDERYYGNASVKMLAVEFSDGKKTNLELTDVASPKNYSLYGEDVTWIKFIIDQVYRGEKWEDTCISEIRPEFTLAGE